MKKSSMIFAALFAFASAQAFAYDTAGAENELTASAASAASSSEPGVARTVGKFFGGLMQSTLAVGRELSAGFKAGAGISDNPSDDVAASEASASDNVTATAATTTSSNSKMSSSYGGSASSSSGKSLSKGISAAQGGSGPGYSKGMAGHSSGKSSGSVTKRSVSSQLAHADTHGSGLSSVAMAGSTGYAIGSTMSDQFDSGSKN